MNRICLFLGAFFSILIGCASIPETTQTFSMSEDQYEDVIESYSDHTQKYDGPYNVLEVHATILNSHVLEAQSLRQATQFQWDKIKYQSELQAKLDGAKAKTEVFVSFFTPDKKSGDLLRADTLWKTILKTETKELPGTPKKLSLLPVEIKSLYPQYNRWSTGYIITFDTPVTAIEKQNSELVITGPVGAATLKFQPIKESVKK
jgi:hypothetical protein